MAILFQDDCSSLDNWTICTDEGHVHYGELFADGDCIYITQENINNNYYDSRQDFYQDCLIGLQDFILEAQIKYEYSKPQREQVASITLYNTENSWERIGFTICPNIDYSGTKGSLYCTNAGSFTFSQNLNYTDDILTYKLCRTGNVLDLYINDIKRGTYENSEIGLVNISGININLGKSRLTDESSLKIPAIYDINISQPLYQFTNGAGTEADPYQVATAADLNGVRDYLTAHFIQTADIDLSGYTNWVPIGDFNNTFTGLYDGNGKSISNMTTTGKVVVGNYNNNIGVAGLFAGIGEGGIVKKLNIDNCKLYPAIAPTSYAYAFAAVNIGYIDQCFATGIIDGSDIGTNYCCMGGISYTETPGRLSNCYAICSIYAYGNNSYACGIGAHYAVGGARIENCYAVVTSNDSTGKIMGIGGIIPPYQSRNFYNSDLLTADPDHVTYDGVPKTTAEMKTGATYTDWNFYTVWGIDPAINEGYPYLRMLESESYDFQYGSGTEADPYQVWTADDLNGVRDYLDAHFIQMADIDLVNYMNWTPIGDLSNAVFSGFFDGQHFSITNLLITTLPGLTHGLFGAVDGGTLKNIKIIDCDITGNLTVGALAGVIGHTSLIENCKSSGEIKCNPVYIQGYAGGLVAFNFGQIKSSSSDCLVSASSEDTSFAGGLVGHNAESSVIEESYASGNVNATGDTDAFVGGLVGNNDTLSSIINCFSLGIPSGSTIGGLVGNNLGTITSSYYDSETSGCSDIDRGTPKTTAEMKEQSTYEGWDFDTIWNIDGVTNDGYPFLRGQKPSDGYNLTITVEGNGTTSPQAGTSQHEAGKNVLLIAYPEPGHKLLRWEGYGVEDTESEYTQIKMTANRSVKAVFAEEAILKLVAAGGGTTNPPPGEISYAKGQVVTLKAAPHRGFKFKEWTKDISSTNDVYELLMDGDKTVWAIFDDDEDDKSTKRKLYFATAREKAFWMINGKWRFFATPVHSNLKKLEADDHKQYLNNERHDKISRHRLGDTVPHDSHENLNNVGFYSHKKIDEHIESMENPHLVTATQVGAIPYLYGDTLPEAGEEYRGFFFTLPGEAGPPEVEDKLYYCRSVDGGTTYEWKEIIFV